MIRDYKKFLCFVIILAITFLLNMPVSAVEIGLNPPTGITASTTMDSIILTWDAVVDATHYYVSFSEKVDGQYYTIATIINSTSFTFKQYPLGQTLYFKVAAMKYTDGLLMVTPLYSSPIGVTMPGHFLPTPNWTYPIQVSSTTITLSWEAVSGANGYTVYKCSGSDITDFNSYIAIYSGSSISCADTGLNPNTEYWYSVSAYDDIGESGKAVPYGATTSRSTPMPTAEPTAIPTTTPAPLLGDVNADGRITSADALMVLQSASGRRTLTGSQSIAADVNLSGTVTSSDALMILQFASGRITHF